MQLSRLPRGVFLQNLGGFPLHPQHVTLQVTGKKSLEDWVRIKEFHLDSIVPCLHQRREERLGSDSVPKRKGLLVAE